VTVSSPSAASLWSKSGPAESDAVHRPERSYLGDAHDAGSNPSAPDASPIDSKPDAAAKEFPPRDTLSPKAQPSGSRVLTPAALFQIRQEEARARMRVDEIERRKGASKANDEKKQ
jgi:hypothetical protein